MQSLLPPIKYFIQIANLLVQVRDSLSVSALFINGLYIAYYNEASLDLEDWQNLFWGSNYARLSDIKKSLDPHSVINCRQCVGSENGF